MAVITANVTLNGGWGAHENARARKHYYTWRRMRAGSVKVRLNWVTSQYNRTGYCGHWANLPYAITVYLRRQSDGAIVSSAKFNDEQQGVTKTLNVPSTGNYAWSFELWHPGDVYTTQNHTLPPYCHLEQYYTPSFQFLSTFQTDTN
uniref:Minor tail protein n=1 Tax=Micrococcus phage Olihed TaxID=3092209 RepID=A0AAU6R622_9CAUD